MTNLYSDKIKFTVVPNSDKAAFDDGVKTYAFETHGLVGLGTDGKQVTKIEGHSFGKDEIIATIQTLLGV